MAHEPAAPPRALGLVGATALVVGSVIGSGIFLAPAIIADHVPGPGLIVAVWLAGGLLSLAAALTFAELGAMFPRAGGQYAFLREAYGDAAGFLFGWMALAVNYSGTIAAVAAACAIYLGALVGFGGFTTKLAAILVIWLLTLVNIRGVREASAVQVASTGAKLLALGGIVVIGVLLGQAYDEQPSVFATGESTGLDAAGAFVLALVAALFAFDGLASVVMVGGEIKDPGRVIPRATILGTLVITAVYLLVTLAFLGALPVEQVAGNERAAFDLGRTLGGGLGGDLIALAIVIATFGTVNGYVLQSPRIYYGMARDGLLYGGFGRLDARRMTPVFGLVLQAEWSSILVLSGSYDQLITYVVVSSWIFYGLTALALFRLRRTRPDADRPYRAWGHPFVPALFVAASVLIVGVSVAFDPQDALIGVGLALSGLPVYVFVRRGRASPKTPS